MGACIIHTERLASDPSGSRKRARIAPGTVLGGRYEIVKELGRGGMAVVYLAMDSRLEKLWAVKALKKQDGRYGDGSLEREARILKGLDHPAIPRVADVVRERDGIFLVMDYIEGEALDKMLERSGAIPQEQAVAWTRQLCGALGYLHSRERPVIHRDIKPGNVMVTPEGNVKLIDFGTAGEYQEQAGAAGMGTRGYAAPEQLERAGRTDARTDIYSLGVTLRQLVTGKSPWEPTYEPKLSPGLEAVIEKCTRPDPGERYQSIRELQYALEHYKEAHKNRGKSLKRRRAAFAAAVLGGSLLLAAGLWGRNWIEGERLKACYARLEEAEELILASAASGEFSPEAVAACEKAIEAAPRREEPYRRLLEYCVDMGQAGYGLDKVCSRLDRMKDPSKSLNGVVMEAAELYFSGAAGDPSFSPDYERAARYFAMADTEKTPEAEYYRELSLSLSLPGSRIHWDSVLRALLRFGEYNASGPPDERRIKNDIALAGVFLANKSGLQRAGADPLTSAVSALERAGEALGYLRDSALSQRYEGTVRRMRGDALYQRALCQETAEAARADFEAARKEYRLLAGKEEESRFQLLLTAADISRSLGEYEQAEAEYRALAEEYPEESRCLSGWGLMALSELGDPETAERLYRRAENLPSAKEDINMETLKRKLENAGRL